MKIYISGQFFDRDDAKISVFDHGLLYGDGVFEGIRVYSGRVFKLREHVQRIFESALSIALKVPLTHDEFEQAIIDTVRLNEIIDGYVRPIVTRGEGTLGLDPSTCKTPQVIIIADAIALYPQEYYEKGLDIVTVSTIRNHPNAINPRIKSLNYLNNVMARMEAALAGCQEALMLNHLGEVAECSGDNVFIVKNDVIKTTPVNSGILEGITRNTVMELARDQNYNVIETPLTRHDVYTADEMLLTGTAAEVISVVKCDGRVIGTGKPGPVFRRLRQCYMDLTQGKYRWTRNTENYMHADWNNS